MMLVTSAGAPISSFRMLSLTLLPAVLRRGEAVAFHITLITRRRSTGILFIDGDDAAQHVASRMTIIAAGVTSTATRPFKRHR